MLLYKNTQFSIVVGSIAHLPFDIKREDLGKTDSHSTLVDLIVNNAVATT